MKYKRYDRDAPIGYAPGVFPSLELMRARPETVRALLYDPRGLKNEGLRQLLGLCEEARVAIEEAPKALERISGKENTYAALVFEKYADELDRNRDHVVLHNISDMGNLGTIIRTCLGFGVPDIAVILPAADPFDPRAVRASMGALFSVRVRCFGGYDEYISFAGEREEYFFRLTDAVPLPMVERRGGVSSFVFGNEASGLTGDLLKRPTGVMIPHSGAIDSLNLSVAVGIGLYSMKGRI